MVDCHHDDSLCIHESPKPIAHDIDRLLEFTKPMGRYQIFLTFIYFYAMCPLSVNNGFMAFSGSVKFVCGDRITNSTTPIPTENCQVYYNCSRENLTFITDFYSIAQEWFLVCDRTYFLSLITSVQMAGNLVGGLSIGYLSDIHGRKWPFTIATALQILLGALSSLSTSWPMFAAFRFFIGCCVGAQGIAAWVLVAEFTTSRFWFIIRVVSTFAQFDQTLAAYLTKEWKWYSIVGNIQAVPLVFLLIFFTFESPRWLAQKERMQDAVTVLKKIAVINGTTKKLPPSFTVQAEDQNASATKTKPSDLFRNCRMASRMTVCVTTWFIISTINYGMYFDIGRLPANIYLTMTIYGVVLMLKIPVAFFDAYNRNMNRKWILLFALVATIVGNVGVIVMLSFSSSSFPYYDIVLSVISVIGQLSVSVAFDQAYVLAIAFFPTLLRSTASAVSSGGARFGALIAPQLLDLHQFWNALPYVCFAFLGFLGFCIDSAFLFFVKNNYLESTDVIVKL